MQLFGYVYLLVPITKHPHDMALGSTIGKYAFSWVPVTFTVGLIMFSEGLKPFFTSEIQATWGMARAALGGSEL